MTNALAQLFCWLNAPANALGRFLLAPVAVLPGWLSITIVSALLGLVCLIVFKYTSPQRTLKRVRGDISAHLMVPWLFPDSLWVTLRAEGRVLRGAGLLLLLAVVPMLVLVIPVSLLLAQLGLWYQVRPLQNWEEGVVTVELRGDPADSLPDVRLEPDPAVGIVAGPVQVLSKREICWNLWSRSDGYHRLVFHCDGAVVAKELAIGKGFMRVSAERPSWCWFDILWQPAEAPLPADSPVRAIRIDYPRRQSGISGSDWWLWYCLAASMFFGFCFRPWIKVAM